MSGSELLRTTRRRHGVSQRSLALRAGTSQSWISNVESGRASPSEAALRRLLLCLGEELVMSTRRLEGHSGHHARLAVSGSSMADRLTEGASWSELASAMSPDR
ncbi:MAG: helix-turn-helix transcriptional regulator [Solirubrobacteraceae bacterium]